MLYTLLMILLIVSILGEKCNEISCSDVIDNICAIAASKKGTKITMTFKNICYMKQRACELDSVVELTQVADEQCNITKPKEVFLDENGRRLYDFSIVGAHQACNHTCPTYCTDTYEPACAQIWKRNMMSFTYRPMINHCHIDLFSCAAGLNVTIQPLGKCYQNPSGLLFMQQVAALRSLHLLDHDDDIVSFKHKKSRRSRNEDPPERVHLKKQLLNVVKNMFRKYSKQEA